MVSIIPGIDTRAPDLTDTNNGFFVPPKVLPVMFSNCFTLFFISKIRSSDNLLPSS